MRPKPDPNSLERVRRLQDGTATEDDSRWLFARYYRWVLGYFLRRQVPEHRAEELTQDTFLQMFREIGTFRGESTFESWLFAIAANVLRNERRRHGQEMRNAPEVPLDATPEDAPPLEIAADQPSPERAAFEEQRRQALGRAIAELPPQMRQCFVLRRERELKYREIAALLKISIDTVKAHLFQARQRLKADLGEELGPWKET